MNTQRIKTIFAPCILLLVLTAASCGDDQRRDFNSSAETFETFINSITYEYDAAESLEKLAARSTVVTKATLKDVEDGRIFGESPDDPFASRTLNLVFDAEDGTRYYVEIARPADSSVDRLREVFPIGLASVIYLQPNNDPTENWYNARSDGNEWFFTTPQGWIVDMPDGGTLLPLIASDEAESLAPVGDKGLDAWLRVAGAG